MYPELQKHGFIAVLGVVTGNIPEDAEDLWSWKYIKKLLGEGYEAASHSVTHSLDLNTKGYLSWQRWYDEFQQSHDKILEKVEIAPVTYVWPFGAIEYQSDALTLYQALCTVWELGPLKTKKDLSRAGRYHPDRYSGEKFDALLRQFV